MNGLPASGKTTVARAVSSAKTWPLLTLDTIKEAFFDHLGTGDRDYNRMLGKASYQAIFDLVRDFPDHSTAVIDAWFGFQPIDVLQAHLERAKVGAVAEIWCHAPGEILGARYGERLAARHAGHLGASYVPELVALAGTARPLGVFRRLDVDTSQPPDRDKLLGWLDSWMEK